MIHPLPWVEFLNSDAKSVGCLFTDGIHHAQTQAERAHVSPNFPYISETFGLWPDLTGIVPTQRVSTIGGIDRILLLVIDHDFVNCRVFLIVDIHLSLP